MRARSTKEVLTRLRNRAGGLLGGAEEGDEAVNKILIIALVSIPLVIVLIVFGGEVVEWLYDAWKELKGEGGTGAV